MTPSADRLPGALRTAAIQRFDADGFLAEPELWAPSVAEDVARLEGVVELTPKHWEVIRLVRDRYHATGALPVMRLICRAAGLDPANAHRLFPGCRSLWRIAGLPNPGEEALAYMH
jgi:TusE/DsrC/DsvC family sulfur relay protein